MRFHDLGVALFAAGLGGEGVRNVPIDYLSVWDGGVEMDKGVVIHGKHGFVEGLELPSLLLCDAVLGRCKVEVLLCVLFNESV